MSWEWVDTLLNTLGLSPWRWHIGRLSRKLDLCLVRLWCIQLKKDLIILGQIVDLVVGIPLVFVAIISIPISFPFPATYIQTVALEVWEVLWIVLGSTQLLIHLKSWAFCIVWWRCKELRLCRRHDKTILVLKFGEFRRPLSIWLLWFDWHGNRWVLRRLKQIFGSF